MKMRAAREKSNGKDKRHNGEDLKEDERDQNKSKMIKRQEKDDDKKTPSKHRILNHAHSND